MQGLLLNENKLLQKSPFNNIQKILIMRPPKMYRLKSYI